MQQLFEQPKSEENRKVFASLLMIALVASLATLPYSIEVLAAADKRTSWCELVPGLLAERAIMAALAIWCGLKLGPALGLDALVLRCWATGEERLSRHWHWVRPSLMCGLCVAVVLEAGSLLYQKSLTADLPPSELRAEEAIEQMAIWKVVLASISAGVVEELLFRFGLMTLFVWIGVKLTNRSRPGPITFWTANLMAALLFGLHHLANVVELGMAITIGMILYVSIANGIAGMAFGWLYRCHGLESAMLAHIVADIVLKGVFPVFERAFQ